MIGTTLSHYRILAPLGEGGMGVVYLAEDQVLQRRVALKVMRPETVGDAARRARFLQEARSAAALHHAHIATIFEASELPDGTLFIAMEHIEGRSLRQMLSSPLPLATALDLGTQIATGLAHAHAHHVVHRDLKPENVLVTPDGQAKILDFGLAKMGRPQDGATIMMGAAPDATQTIAAPVAGLTVQGQIMGTPAYMSPEQARGHEVDSRSDVFSFGSMLYEMCVGKPSFAGPTPLDTLSAVLHVEPPAVSHVVRGAPPALERVIVKCLQKETAHRYASTADLVRDLRAVDPNDRGRRVRLPRSSKLLYTASAVLVAAAAGVYLAPHLSRRDGKGAQNTAAAGKLDRILVSDFETTAPSPGLAVATRELVAAALSQSSIVTPITRSQLTRGLRLAQLPDSTRITAEVARQLAFRGGARTFVEGRIDPVLQGYSIILKVVDSDTGKEIVTLSGTAKNDAEVIEALENLGHQLREELGEKRSAVRSTGQLRESFTPSFDAYRAYVNGIELQRKRQWKASHAAYQEALRLDPKFATAYSALGIVYNNQGLPDSARVVFEKALSYPDRLTNAARLDLQVSMRLADYDLVEALQLSDALLQATSSPPPSALNNRGFMQFALGKYEDALVTQQRAVEASVFGASQLVFLNEFQIAMQVGNYERGRALVDSLTGANRQLAQVALAVNLGQWIRADSLCAGLLGPDVDEEMRFQAEVVHAAELARRGAVVASARALEDLAGRAPTALWGDEVRMARVQLGIMTGRPISPTHAVLKSPTLAGHLVRGIAAAAAGDTAAARAELRAVAGRPKPEQRRYDVDTRLLQAWMLAASGRWDEAARTVDPLIAQGPGPWFTGRVPLRWLSGAAHEQAGPDSSAVRAYEQVLDPRRLHHDVWVWRAMGVPFANHRLANLYARSGRRQAAEKHARALVDGLVEPDSLTAPLLQAAQEILRSAAAANPG